MGFFEAAFARKMGRELAYEAEVGVAIEGVSSAIMLGWTKIHLESDSTYVVSLFGKKNLKVPWKFRSCWDWLQEKLSDKEFHVSHIFREGNSVADAISTFQDFDRFIWWNEVPDFLASLVANDRHLEYFRLQ